MCEIDVSASDVPAALEESASTSGSNHRFRLKLRSILKQSFKASDAPTTLEGASGAANIPCGPVLEVRPDIEKTSQPSNISVASKPSKVYRRVSLSRASSKLENDPRKSRSSTTSENTSSANKLIRGSIVNMFSTLQNSQPSVECSARCRLKPPIIKSRTYPGPSNLAERCQGSTVQFLSEGDLDILSKYWHFRIKFDRVARTSYRQGEELECLLRCTKLRPRILSFDVCLSSAHTELHKGLGRLHCCMKKNEGDLDEETACIVLAETMIFMKNLESLTADLQLACKDLQGIFDNAINSEGSLERSMSKPKTALSEAWKRRRTSTCWTLCRETDRLRYAISCEGRRAKANGAEAAIGNLGKEQSGICIRTNANRKYSDVSQSSLDQIVNLDSAGIDQARSL